MGKRIPTYVHNAYANKIQKINGINCPTKTIIPLASEICQLSSYKTKVIGNIKPENVIITFLEYCSMGSIYGNQFPESPLAAICLQHKNNPTIF